ncbi:hypothetical protein [Ostreiculturibacter nitratireducens]|uniref:hypothetical protein n=1 Tax=Ostreiculturibacter nitratireducens TaxID=3075226 RepID=UPI0031B63390
MRRLTPFVLAVLVTVPAVGADAPLTGPEFDALSQGKTLFYSSGSEPYGVEEYLPGRKVRWAFVGDQCMEGYWYEEGEFICFVYDRQPIPQCWTFYDTPQGLMARFRGDPEGMPLVAVEESPEPLACAGPDVGV